MKEKILYCCEFCDAAPFADMSEAWAHEASHFGLSPAEYSEWSQLRLTAASKGKMVGCANNDKTRKAFDKAIHALVDFETAHNISSDARASR